MPRAFRARHELDQPAVAAHQEVGGYFHARNGRVVRVRRGIQAVGEEFDDAVAAKLARRQADVMDDEEFDRAAGRPFVAVGRRNEPCAPDQPAGGNGSRETGFAFSLFPFPFFLHRLSPWNRSRR
ncbi:hypothetical protein D3C83_35420 [compost metagenome]